ncbi:POU domain, class 6, transcription factor 1 [Numida meleagris]|uniref:POU domain, class 6, transcription factor 1 n=1 Tax=Numida meleagris TaxID=8996 RepID=UPI000B3D9381|nr:POU domain, class 6, transcription factor 1 [Numida meleagris]
MDAAAVRSQDAPLTVNEQVIVMSGHETIRVLEVGVDAAPPPEEERRAGAVPPGDGSRGSPARSGDAGTEDARPSAETPRGTEAAGKAKPSTGAPPGAVGTLSPTSNQQPQPLAPLAVQAAPQVLTQENLATVVTGVMVPAGTVTQPLLIPISIAGQVAGQQGLAVWTFPTATVAALPGLTAASPTGGIFKPPIANLQGNRCSSALQHPSGSAAAHAARPPAEPAAPNSSAEEDGINLEEIREFAKNFKIRRLSLGLTQTQVGQALTATEGPAYSQSAICRWGTETGRPPAAREHGMGAWMGWEGPEKS